MISTMADIERELKTLKREDVIRAFRNATRNRSESVNGYATSCECIGDGCDCYACNSGCYTSEC